MDPKQNSTGEREFLHDICNLVAIAQGNLHLLIRRIEKNPSDVKVADLLPKLEASINAIGRMVEQLSARRLKLRAEEVEVTPHKAAS